MVLGPLADFSATGLVLGGFGVYVVLSVALSYLRARRYPGDIKPVGAGKGFFAVLKDMSTWAQDGYDVYNKRNKAYLLPGVLGNDPQVIVPRSQIPWMLDQPDTILSTAAAHYDTLHGDYSFVNAEVIRNPWHEHVIHRSLARHLPGLLPGLQQEICDTTDDIFGFDDKEWRTFNIWDVLFKEFIPRVTNSIFVGAPACRDPDYLASMVAITEDIVRNMPLLGLVPPVLKPLFGPLASLPARYHYWRASRHVLPILEQRLADFEKQARGDPEYADWTPPNDYFSWHIAVARAEGRTSELDPNLIAQRLIPLNFAALHTTSLTALQALLDILSSDAQHGTLAALAEEVRREYAAEGGCWTKAGLARLFRLDSAIRESMRVSAIAQTLVQKKVVAPGGIRNPETGWFFEYGTLLSCPLWGAHHDRDLYGDGADSYDPFRYSREREAGGKNADERLRLQQKGMVTTSDSHLPFGHGRHACPGRFFVAHELKMLFAHLLLNYDLKPLEERPKPQWFAAYHIPPTHATMQVKRRPGTF